jgi:anoctamin-10/anoctamin-7
MGAEDILTWMDALQIVSYIAVMTNSALICFSMEVIQLSLIYKLWIFFFLQYSILFAMYIFDRVVDDMPEDVSYNVVDFDDDSGMIILMIVVMIIA